MVKSELVQRIHQHNPHLYVRHVEGLVDAILDTITAALADGNRVEIRGFGVFSRRHRIARLGRNPRTGGSVMVEPKHLPFFKVAKELRARLNR